MDLHPRDVMQKLEEVGQEMRRTITALELASQDAAKLDSQYRLCLIGTSLRSDRKTMKEREWEGQHAAENQRYEAKLAEGKRNALTEKIRALRTECESWIAVTYLMRSEIRMAGVGYE